LRAFSIASSPLVTSRRFEDDAKNKIPKKKKAKKALRRWGGGRKREIDDGSGCSNPKKPQERKMK